MVFNPLNNRQPKTNWKKGNLCTLWENAKKLANTFYIHVGKDGPQYTEFVSTDHEDCIHLMPFKNLQVKLYHYTSASSAWYPSSIQMMTQSLACASPLAVSRVGNSTLHFTSIPHFCFSFEKEDQGLWNHQVMSLVWMRHTWAYWSSFSVQLGSLFQSKSSHNWRSLGSMSSYTGRFPALTMAISKPAWKQK